MCPPFATDSSASHSLSDEYQSVRSTSFSYQFEAGCCNRLPTNFEHLVADFFNEDVHVLAGLRIQQLGLIQKVLIPVSESHYAFGQLIRTAVSVDKKLRA